MKTISKTLKTLAFVCAAGLSTATAAEGVSAQDSVIIKFGTGGKIVIHVDSDKDKERMKNIDMNEVVKRAQAYMDSAKTVQGSFMVDDKLGEMRVTYNKEEDKGEKNFRVTIGKNGINIIEDKNSSGSNDTAKKSDNDDDDKKDCKTKCEGKQDRATKSYWRLEVGLNNYLENGKLPDNNAAYRLNPLGSRYISLESRRSTRFGGKKSPMRFEYGLGLSSYNYVFDNKFTIVKQTGGVTFEPTAANVTKSKLSALYLNVPVMVKFKMKKSSLGLGGYAGYRLDAHTKIVSGSRRKDKEKTGGDFFLNDFRYGAKAELKIKDFSVFASYDFSPVFQSGITAPALNTLTVGISL